MAPHHDAQIHGRLLAAVPKWLHPRGLPQSAPGPALGRALHRTAKSYEGSSAPLGFSRVRIRAQSRSNAEICNASLLIWSFALAALTCRLVGQGRSKTGCTSWRLDCDRRRAGVHWRYRGSVWETESVDVAHSVSGHVRRQEWKAIRGGDGWRRQRRGERSRPVIRVFVPSLKGRIRPRNISLTRPKIPGCRP